MNSSIRELRPPKKRINSRPNVRPETTKILRENVICYLLDIRLSNTFMDLSPKARETKAKNKVLGPQGNEKLFTEKELINQTKRQGMGWAKIFARM